MPSVCRRLDTPDAMRARIAELENALRVDPLTGLPTKQAFYETVAETGRKGDAVMFLDLDDFGSVNADYGYELGDRLLCSIAEAIRATVAPQGFVARLVGDEFLVLWPAAASEDAQTLASRLLRAVKSCTIACGELRITRAASIGLARLDTTQLPITALLSADAALSEAKRNGKNRVAVPAERATGLHATRPTREEVQLGLQRREIGYHLQPIIDLQDGEVWGYEALLRWHRANGEVLGPAHFLDTMTRAYDDDTRPPLEAARAVADWVANQRGLTISFNVSGAFLAQTAQRGVGWIAEIAGRIPYGQVMFELVETVVEDTDGLADVVADMRARGVRIALDDFGTGQSTLSRLQTIPVDFVKIDRRFVTAAAESRRDAELLRGMIDLSHASGADTVVEGIETEAQLEAVRAAGARLVQGFLLGRPAPMDHWAAQGL